MKQAATFRSSLVWLLLVVQIFLAPASLAQQSLGPSTVQAPPAATNNADGAKKAIVSAQANEATIRVTRKDTDQYLVTSIGNGGIVIKTRYCHEYVRDEEAVMQTSDDGAENALLFATGAYCEVVGVSKANDRSYGLIDFLVDIGLMLLNRATGGLIPRATPKAKRE